MSSLFPPLSLLTAKETRGEQEDAGEVDRGVCQHLEQDRELPSHTRGATAALGFVLREAELVDAIRDQRVARPHAIGAPGVAFGEMRQDESAEVVGAGDEAFEAMEQRIVVENLDLLESMVEVHSRRIHRCFAASWALLRLGFVASDEFSCRLHLQTRWARGPLRGISALGGIHVRGTRSARKRVKRNRWRPHSFVSELVQVREEREACRAIDSTWRSGSRALSRYAAQRPLG